MLADKLSTQHTMAFHPTQDKLLVYAGDMMGNFGIFDASHSGTPEANGTTKSERADDEEDEDSNVSEPAISSFKFHARTMPHMLLSSSYDSLIRSLDFGAGKFVEVYLFLSSSSAADGYCVDSKAGGDNGNNDDNDDDDSISGVPIRTRPFSVRTRPKLLGTRPAVYHFVPIQASFV
jgi:hypothetical protein